MEQAAEEAAAQELPQLNRLPADLLRKVLRLLDSDDQCAAFQACRAFAEALVASGEENTTGIALALNVRRHSSAAAKLLESLGARSRTARLVLSTLSSVHARPDDLISQQLPLQLTCVSTVELKGLLLDGLIPAGLDQLLPNLRALRIQDCILDGTRPLDAALPSLTRLELGTLTLAPHLTAPPPPAAAAADEEPAPDDPLRSQLSQLARLPRLAAVELLPPTAAAAPSPPSSQLPTDFLPSLAGQLTSLSLQGEMRPHQHQTPAGWAAALRHVAACTRLERLAAPVSGGEELRVAAPALACVARLHLNLPHAPPQPDADVMLDLLFGSGGGGRDGGRGAAAAPELSELVWDHCYALRALRSRAHLAGCRLRQLSFGYVGVAELGVLPLRSLTSKVCWKFLKVDQRTSVADAEAAVQNVAAAGFAWDSEPPFCPTLTFTAAAGGRPFTHGASETADTAEAILRALRPLMLPAAAQTGQVGFTDLAVATPEVVRALRHAVGPGCRGLVFGRCALPLGVCDELALQFPDLEDLHLNSCEVSPSFVFGVALALKTRWRALAAAAAGAGGAAPPRLREVNVHMPTRPEDVPEAVHEWAWNALPDAVGELGLGEVQVHVWGV